MELYHMYYPVISRATNKLLYDSKVTTLHTISDLPSIRDLDRLIRFSANIQATFRIPINPSLFFDRKILFAFKIRLVNVKQRRLEPKGSVNEILFISRNTKSAAA